MNNLDFFSEVGKLKDVKRTGWQIYNVSDPETVSDHSYRLAVMCLHYCKDLNMMRCVGMALAHDLPEITVGDVAIHIDKSNQTVSDEDKKTTELVAAKELFKNHPEMFSLWEEYEDNETPESKLVHDLDKVEMVLQALEYQTNNRTKEHLEEFFQTSEPRIQTEKGKELWDEVRRRFLEFHK